MKINTKFYFVIIAFVIACNSNNQVEEKSIEDFQREQPSFIWPKNIRGADTLENNTIYKSEVYFTNDSLLKVSKTKNIKDYLKVDFLLPQDDSLRSALIKNDTAYIKFKVEVPELERREIVEYKWTYKVYLKFNKETLSHDTTFITVDKFYVKGT